MATIVLIYGNPGRGKSTSMMNLPVDRTLVLKVADKDLPFRGGHKFEQYVASDYKAIAVKIRETAKDIIVIDDATYLMTNEYMRERNNKSYDRFVEIAYKFDALVQFCGKQDSKKTIYFMGHSTMDELGNVHFKTIGKMLDNMLSIEGRFGICLQAVVNDGKYYFQTHNSGLDTVKSPVGMFTEELIPNDLALVDNTIREYYEL